jgi:serpin B
MSQCYFTRSLLAAVVLGLCLGGSLTGHEPVQKKSSDWQKAKQLGAPISDFGFELYQQLRSKKGNLFLSPASLSTGLAMTYAGAAGQTEKEMAHVLHFDGASFDKSERQFSEAYGELTKLLNTSSKGCELSMANRLWGQKSYPFLPEFLTLTREDFGAELASLDFTETEAARQTINSWVEERTREKIRDLIPSGVLLPSTRLVLTNAIYFNGQWAVPFSKDATQPAAFYRDSNNEVQVPTMSQTRMFKYGENDKLQLLELPYAGNEVSLVVLLPRAKDGLAGVEAELSGDNVRKWCDAAKRREVEVHLPKIKMTSDFRLAETLRKMGMATAISPRADFSKISSSEGLMISEVLHKAFVEVNEKGTEAAAATAVIIAPTAALRPEREEPVVFRADHPFILMIRHNPTGVILFLGRVADPRGN